MKIKNLHSMNKKQKLKFSIKFKVKYKNLKSLYNKVSKHFKSINNF